MSGGHLSKEFFELVKSIGESKSKQEEDRIILHEVALLKRKLNDVTASSSTSSGLVNKRKREFLIRLMYVEMLGHDASFGYIKAVEMTASTNLMQKRVGYLTCSLCLSPTHEFRFMIINQLQRDLQSSNHLEVCAALMAVCKLVTVEMVPAVQPMILDLLRHDAELVRKKAVMAIHRFHQLNPESVTDVGVALRRTLCDRDPSVMGTTLCILHDLAEATPTDHKDLVPSFVSILKQITEHRLPREFDYHRIPAPWIQIRLLKILALLGQADQQTSEGMYEVLHDVMRRADTGINVGTQTHAYRMYFMGPNNFREPWHLPYSPPGAIIEIVYEDAFNSFINEINSTAAYDWWEGSVHSILSVLANPCAWSWKQWRRRRKIHRLQEYVKSQYDHSCLRSCRSRALYKGMKVGATPDLMVAYIDFFLGGDEKRVDMVSIIQKRFPMCILFGGDGSYMSPYSLHSDTLLTNLLGQHIPPSVWHRFVAGLNAQLRTVRHGSIRSALLPVIRWINSHGNPQLEFHGVRIELGWFQATASGYYQLGILVFVGDFPLNTVNRSLSFSRSDDESPGNNSACPSKSLIELQQNLIQPGHGLSRKRINGGINGGLINEISLESLEYRRDLLFPFSLLLNNTRPVGRQDTLLRFISILLLADLSVTLLALLQFYWLALAAFLAILLILPLSLLCPFPAGLNALLSKEMRRASLTRIYGLWNATSLTNVIVAFICGVIHSGFFTDELPNIWNAIRDDDKWWVLPTFLLLLKSIQARFLDWHVANLEVPDFSLLCPDPDTFWAYESGA